MKLFLLVTGIWFCSGAFAQQKSEFDSSGILPHFTFFNLDGNVFNADSIDADKKTILIYFKTDCEYCETEISSVLQKINSYKNVQVILLSREPLKDIKAFIAAHQIDQYPQVKMIHDKDLSYYLYYHTKFTPTTHIYYQGKLLFFADGEADMDELEKFLE